MEKQERSPLFNSRFDKDPSQLGRFDYELIEGQLLPEQDATYVYQDELIEFIRHCPVVIDNGERKANWSGLKMSFAFGIGAGFVSVRYQNDDRLEVMILKNHYIFIRDEL